jgi:hypothetical protein
MNYKLCSLLGFKNLNKFTQFQLQYYFPLYSCSQNIFISFFDNLYFNAIIFSI